MQDLLNGVSPAILILFAINFFLVFVLFMMNISNRIKLRKLKEKYNKFMNGLSGVNIEQVLENCIDLVNGVAGKNIEIENHMNDIERNLIQCIQKVGIVRYNAFENVGSDLSFSLALLDNNDTGLVISAIYSRDSSLTYGKPISGGKSRYTLSAEEMQAIEAARKYHKERLYTGK